MLPEEIPFVPAEAGTQNNTIDVTSTAASLLWVPAFAGTNGAGSEEKKI
jgi:hypothetical protein